MLNVEDPRILEDLPHSNKIARQCHLAGGWVRMPYVTLFRFSSVSTSMPLLLALSGIPVLAWNHRRPSAFMVLKGLLQLVVLACDG